MNLSSSIVLIIIVICFYFAIRSIKNGSCSGCIGQCSGCSKHKKCNEKSER